MVKAKSDALLNAWLIASFVEQLKHRAINVRSIGDNVRKCRSREHAALRACMHLADRVVIRVEQKIILFVESLITANKFLEYEALEEPGDMRKMPLGRTDIGHRLHDGVFSLE